MNGAGVGDRRHVVKGSNVVNHGQVVKGMDVMVGRHVLEDTNVVNRRHVVKGPDVVHRRYAVKHALSSLAAAVLLAACSSHGAAAAPAASAAADPSAGSSLPAGPSNPAAPAASPDSASPAGERVVHVTAKKFEYSPSEIHVKKGEPVVLEFVSLDRKHGFEAPDLGLSTEIDPKTPSRLRFVPEKEGRFPFHCSVFCGDGHEDMTGEIVVDP